MRDTLDRYPDHVDLIEQRPPQPPEVKSCNRHSDCEEAEKRYYNHHGTRPWYTFHCYSDDCEDCFGQ